MNDCCKDRDNFFTLPGTQFYNLNGRIIKFTCKCKVCGKNERWAYVESIDKWKRINIGRYKKKPELFHKFVVIKAEDAAECLSYEERIQFSGIFEKIEKYRKKCGKDMNEYLVVNRDEKYAAEVEKMILGGE